MKRALVCGSTGFIGHHLVKKLKEDGYWVRGVDINQPIYSALQEDEFTQTDLRNKSNCMSIFKRASTSFDEVYQLAANMGGVGYLSTAEYEILHHNALINLNIIKCCSLFQIPKLFFSSSVCVYKDLDTMDEELVEEEAYPALPNNEYGWEKLFAERLLAAYSKKNNLSVHIGHKLTLPQVNN